MAKENPRWGYKRIQGAVANLGSVIPDTAVANILRAHAIDPAPDRKRQGSWKEFLNTHWDMLASVDFTAIGIWAKKGWALNPVDPNFAKEGAGTFLRIEVMGTSKAAKFGRDRGNKGP